MHVTPSIVEIQLILRVDVGDAVVVAKDVDWRLDCLELLYTRRGIGAVVDIRPDAVPRVKEGVERCRKIGD